MFSNFIGFLKYLFCPKKQFCRQLWQILGFFPRYVEYYEIAFIHKSASIIKENGEIINNERLEFLGDAILDAVISDVLYKRYPNNDEGFLTQMRSKMVNGETLSELAQHIQLDKLVIANISVGNRKRHIFEDAFEALIGAIYLDRGYKFTEKFVQKNIIDKHFDLEELRFEDKNYKSQLIEWAQKNKQEVQFETKLIKDQPKVFKATVVIDNQKQGSGQGGSKKEAEQDAAQKALDNLRFI